MKLDEYLQQLPTRRLSPVKRVILTTLWGEDDDTFPKPWVASRTLLERTEQKYFDRRIRELRDDVGCDLETEYVSELGDHAWRLTSVKLNAAKPRSYLTARQRAALFERYDFCCAVCGVRIPSEQKGLQADHKVPLSRGGDRAASNWQPLCQNCNVAKRRACQGCDLLCETCGWAYPEQVGIRTTIAVREPTLRRLDSFIRRIQGDRDAVVSDAINAYLDTYFDARTAPSHDDSTPGAGA